MQKKIHEKPQAEITTLMDTSPLRRLGILGKIIKRFPLKGKKICQKIR